MGTHKYRQSIGSRAFDVANFILLGLFALVTLVPFLNVVSSSLTAEAALIKSRFILFPPELSFDAYRYIFGSDSISRSLLITIYITVVGTAVNLFFTGLLAFSLAHKTFVARRIVMSLIVFTILFSPGMIPRYFVVKWTGLMNSLWSLIIPNAISAFYLILWKNFFQSIPFELEESAKMDGAKEWRVLFSIYLPVSKAAIATFTLFYAVSQWNQFLSAILFINDSAKWPIQVLLRQVVILSAGGISELDEVISGGHTMPPQSVKTAVIVVATLPILLVYPFLQRYFAKGVMLGSVKG